MIEALLGAFFNRVRGGWLLPKYNRTVNAIAFGITFFTDCIVNSVLMMIAMFTGMSLGWGRYIGALGGWETRELSEVKFIDWFISPLKKRARIWGFAGLTLRGLLVGLPIAFIDNNICPLIAGLLMGICYLIPISIVGRKGWEYGEIVFGAILWYSVTI